MPFTEPALGTAANRDARMSNSVSVVVPLHNGARFIIATLSSVAAQTWAPLEVIVVDDHSSDDGAALAAAVSGVTLIRANQRGPAAARQLGIERARGESIAFLDHDDLWAPWHLATLARALAQHPECAFVYADAVPFTDGEAPLFNASDAADVAVDPWAWQPSCFILSPSCTLLRRDALLRIGGWNTAPVADLGTYLQLSARAPVRRCRTSVGYRQTAGSNAQRLRREPEALLADHVTTLRQVISGRSNTTTRAQLHILEHLGALDQGDRAALQQLADAFAKAPTTLSNALSHAHWLYGPRWRASNNARLIELRSLWPPAHPTSRPVRRWLSDCLSFAQLRAYCRAKPFQPARWHALMGSSWRRAIRRAWP